MKAITIKWLLRSWKKHSFLINHRTGGLPEIEVFSGLQKSSRLTLKLGIVFISLGNTK